MSENISDSDKEIILDFAQESRELIEQLEPSLIELGQKEDEQQLNSIFRLFHSLKGGAGFIGLTHIAHATHACENLLDQIRSGNISLKQPDHIDLFCRACDFLKEAMDHVEEHLNDNDLADQADILASEMEQALNEGEGEKPAEDSGTQDTEQSPPVPGLESLQSDVQELEKDISKPVEPELDLTITPEMIQQFVQESDEILQSVEQGLLNWLKTPDDMNVVADMFRNIHTFKGNCGFYGYTDLERLSHKMETVLEVVKSGANMGKNNPAKILLQFVDVLRVAVESVARGGNGQIDNLDVYLDLVEGMLPKGWQSHETGLVPPGRLGEILVEEGELTSSELDSALKTQSKPIGEILVEKGLTTPQKVDDALKKQNKKSSKPAAKGSNGETKQAVLKKQDIRVDLGKLDSLINIIGEMVIAENMVVRNPDLEGLELENFTKAAQHMNKIVRELQEMAMVIRMVPVSGLFRRMIRLVHDVSSKLGKSIDLKIIGEETELDKTVIETITDPLVHLIRNSLDHGLEPPDERLRAGKDKTGTVTLTAVHEEGEVWIVVEDDGRGLNREKIIAKAVSSKLIAGDGLDLSDKAVFNLIFQPGFSTADKVTDVSGRGVGMDVVKKNLEKINGKIEVKSKLGHGSKIILRIPLTLAIIEGMMARVGDAKYILPILSIRETFSPDPKAITISPDGEELVRIREEFFPVVRLHDLYKLTPQNKELHDGILIVLETQELNYCLFVDEILGQQQTVIKGLSGYIGNIRGVSGCTILGNGDVCMILDVNGLLELKRAGENGSSR